MNENDLPRCSRVCCRTRQALEPGDTYYSALSEEKEGLVRLDFSPAAWKKEKGPFLGWWRSVVPKGDEKKVRLAPNDILFELFDQWLGDPQKEEYLYVLSLLMVRRRLMRFEKGEDSGKGANEMTIYAPRRETSYIIGTPKLSPERIADVQETLAGLIYPDRSA